MLDINSFIILIVSFAVFFLSIIVFLKGNGKILNNLFGLILGFYSIWCFSSFFNHVSSSSSIVDFFTKMSYVATIFSLAIMTLFCEVQVFSKSKILQKGLLYIIPAIVISLVILFTPYIVTGGTIRTQAQAESVIPGNLFILYGILSLVYVVLSLKYIFISIKRSKGAYKDQAFYILLGVSFSIGAGVLMGIILPTFHITQYGHLTPITSTSALLFVYYAIFKHRFLDIRIFVAKSLELLVYGLYTYVFVYLSIYINSQVFDDMYNPNAYILQIVLVIVFILISKYIFYVSNRYVSSNFNNESFTIQLNNLLGHELNPSKVAEIFSKFISRKFSVTFVSTFIKNGDCYTKLSEYSNKESVNIQNLPNNIESILKSKQPVLVEDFYPSDKIEENILKVIKEYNVEILLPIYFDNVLYGIILIGGKESGGGFSIQDIELLGNFILPFTFSLQRAGLYVENQSFTQTLQQKVDEATKKLQEQNKELEERYREERDMIGILGHELRTPLTIGRGSIEYILKKSQEFPQMPVSDLSRQIHSAYVGCKREAVVVETLLSASHIDNNNLEINFEEVNLDTLIKIVIEDNMEEATRKKLTLEYHLPKKLSSVKCQSSRAQEILDNLVSNAVKYTKEGRIDVSVREENGYVYVDVQDTGDGIAKKDLPHIGKKFFRAHNYLEKSHDIVRPGGNGLGVYVTKGILQVSGGDLLIKSKLGKGSTFTAKFAIFVKHEQKCDDQEEEVSLVGETDMFVKLGLRPKI